MARKKKRAVKSKSKRAKILENAKGKISSQLKLKVVLRNLGLFVLLALIAFILYSVLEWGEIWQNVFYLLFVVLGFIALAFLISLLVLLVLKWIKR
jgi:hypothetical protein